MSPPKVFTDGWEPKAFTKQKFCHMYNLVTSLQHVKVEPISQSVFNNKVLQSCLNTCTDFCISKTSASGKSLALLRFSSVEEGDGMRHRLSEALGKQAEVTHPPVSADLDLTALTEPHLDIYHWARKANGAEPLGTLGERCVVLENMPPCDQNKLLQSFSPRQALDFTADSSIKDLVVLEMPSRDEASAFIKKHDGSKFEGHSVHASSFPARMRTLHLSCLVFHKEEETGISFLSDEARMKQLTRAVQLDEEYKQLLNGWQLSGLDKLNRCRELLRELESMRRPLVGDARRRLRGSQPLPEATSQLQLSSDFERQFSAKAVKKANLAAAASAPEKRGPTPLFGAGIAGPGGGFRGPGGGPAPKRAAQHFSGPNSSEAGSMTASFGGGGPPAKRSAQQFPGEPSFSSDPELVTYLTDRVKQLTEEARMLGKDPTFKLKNSVGLGRSSKIKPHANPVIQGLRVRIEELEDLLSDRPESFSNTRMPRQSFSSPSVTLPSFPSSQPQYTPPAPHPKYPNFVPASQPASQYAPEDMQQGSNRDVEPSCKTDSELIAHLSDRVKQLTEEARMLGKDPTFKLKNSVGLGRSSKIKPHANPVIQGLRVRIEELEDLLHGRPKQFSNTRQLRNSDSPGTAAPVSTQRPASANGGAPHQRSVATVRPEPAAVKSEASGPGSASGGAGDAGVELRGWEASCVEEITNEVEVQILTDLVQELKDAVKAQGKDLNMQIGPVRLGRHNPNHQEVGAPVLVGLRNRLKELVLILKAPPAPKRPVMVPNLLPRTSQASSPAPARQPSANPEELEMLNILRETAEVLTGRPYQVGNKSIKDCIAELRAVIRTYRQPSN